MKAAVHKNASLELRRLRREFDRGDIISPGALIFEWWLRQIKSLAPWLRAPARMQTDALIIEVEKFNLSSSGAPLELAGNVLARRGGCEVLIAPLDQSFQVQPHLTQLPLVGLRLPAEMTLRRQVVFPVMVERHLQTVIAFEIDRLTPFTIHEVLWGIDELKREHLNLKLTLLIIPRSTVEAVLAVLARMALAPCFVESGGGYIRLGQRVKKKVNALQAALLGVCCILAFTFVSIPVIHQQCQLDALDRQIKTLMPQRQEISFLRGEIANYDSGATIAAAAQENGDDLQILAMLTKVLPDSTWLDQLSLTPNKITISGQSKDAAHLIYGLAAAPGFHNPNFIAPVTRTTGNSADIFSIQVSIER